MMVLNRWNCLIATSLQPVVFFSFQNLELYPRPLSDAWYITNQSSLEEIKKNSIVTLVRCILLKKDRLTKDRKQVDKIQVLSVTSRTCSTVNFVVVMVFELETRTLANVSSKGCHAGIAVDFQEVITEFP
jgi:hypothetical protein